MDVTEMSNRVASFDGVWLLTVVKLSSFVFVLSRERRSSRIWSMLLRDSRSRAAHLFIIESRTQ